MQAQEILQIPLTNPEKLFITSEQAHDLYRHLAKQWHPDKNKAPDAENVFQHLNLLYTLAKKKISDGVWEIPNLLTLETVEGKRFNISYSRKHEFALGELYISRGFITICVNKDNKDLFDVYKSRMKFVYANDQMKKEISKYMPVVYKDCIETKDKFIIFINKSQDLILAKDMLDNMGTVPIKHVCWILSSLYNIAAYLQYSKICHGDISMESYYISPKFHAGALLGGWWYSKEYDKPLVALPKRSISLVSPKIITEKKPCSKIDLEGIKALGRELLKDPTGINLDKVPDMPKSLSGWLRFPSGDNAFEEYKNWMKTLEKAYGKRKYTELKLEYNDVYK